MELRIPGWPEHAVFLDRWFRNAFAASLIEHPNLLSIVDFGIDRATPFLVSERSPGISLQERVQRDGPLDAREAAAVVLQACRGVKAAHDQGLSHRAIGPEAVFLEPSGLVRVAGPGAVMTPELAEALGSPPPSASAQPEASNPADQPSPPPDPAALDRRADMHNLGALLAWAITGQTCIREGTLNTSSLQGNAPPDLVEIVTGMAADRPEERFADLGEAITALEGFLGIPAHETFVPRQEHADLLATSADQFRSAPAARERSRAFRIYFGSCFVLVVLATLAGWPWIAGTFLSLAALSAAAYALVDGITRGTPLWRRVRSLLLGGSISDALTVLVALALLALALAAIGALKLGLTLGLAGLVLALMVHYWLDRRLARERAPALDAARTLLRGWRRLAIDEWSLRRFAARHAGVSWEPFFEALFGFEARIATQRRFAIPPSRDSWFASTRWRDWFLHRLDDQIATRNATRRRPELAQALERGLEGRGLNLLTARRQSRRVADALTALAIEHGRDPESRSRPVSERLEEALTRPEEVLVSRERGFLRPRPRGVLARLLGPRFRFLLGAVLVALWVVWMHQNALVPAPADLQESARQMIRSPDLDSAAALASGLARSRERPLRIGRLPLALTSWMSGHGLGLAGAILLLTSILRGWRISLFVLPAAAVLVAGESLGIPPVGPIEAWAVCLFLAGMLVAIGLVTRRD